METVGRPPVKRDFIVDELRTRIIAGEFQPGERLPSRRECAREFAVTLKTVQQALSSLEQDGMVVSRSGLGTFVADEPPHLHQIALAFPCAPGEPGWGLFWEHLVSVARRVVEERGVRLSVYTGITRGRQGGDYARLQEDLRCGRVAGLILASYISVVRGTDILESPGVPRVSIASPDPSECPSIGHIVHDTRSFCDKAVAHLKGKGVRSAAVLTIPGDEDREILQRLAAAGIACPTKFQQAIANGSPSWARNLMALMFDREHPCPPESLIVMDDNLFVHALGGILEAGLRVPQDVEIITHSNFPWQLTSPVPITRLGYDVHQLLNLALTEIESQRAGNPPQVVSLPALFEDELAAAPHYRSRRGVTEYLPTVRQFSQSARAAL